MKYLARFSVLVLALAVMVGCNNDSSTWPTESPQGPEAQSADRFGRADFDVQDAYEFEITLENMAPATQPGASQPFSPPVLATHTPLFHIFQVARYASDELAQIAEDAVSGPMVEMLDNSDFVYSVAQGDGVILPGGSATFHIKAKPGYHKLSLVSMLVNTNDGFTGVDAMRLPFRGTKTYYLHAYDAGTEKNTESTDHIPGPCCGNPLVRVPTHQRIYNHPGISGHGDLDPAVYGWDEPVAKLTIRMVQ